MVAFVCNWCTYTGADLAGTSRLTMAPNVRIVRLPCSGRIDPLMVLKAFERGADGVIVSGCHPGDCHYTSGNLHARRRFALFHDLLQFLGFDEDRLTFSWVSASEGLKWRETVDGAVERVRELGPFEGFRHDRIAGAEAGTILAGTTALAGTEAGTTGTVAPASVPADTVGPATGGAV